jgi:hypothetical protein
MIMVTSRTSSASNLLFRILKLKKEDVGTGPYLVAYFLQIRNKKLRLKMC